MISVLVVDDEPSLGRAIQRDLVAHGFDAHLCTSAEEALAVLARLPIDVLLTDLRMAGADGIDLLRRARQLSARTRSILMSGHATARDYQTAMELGAIRVLCKPFTPEELMAAVKQAADCDWGFHGQFHGLSIIDVLQMLHLSRRAIVLAVRSPQAGAIYLREGELFHAECGTEVGEAALRSLLALPTGTLGTEALPEETRVTITRPFEPVLLDAVRAIDEGRVGEWATRKNGKESHVQAASSEISAGPIPLPRLLAEEILPTSGPQFGAPPSASELKILSSGGNGSSPYPVPRPEGIWPAAGNGVDLARGTGEIFAATRPTELPTNVFERWRRPTATSPAMPSVDETQLFFGGPPPPAATLTRPRRPVNPASESFERGLELLRRRELVSALEEWKRAAELEPDNRTYRANLRRLERLVAEAETK